MAGDARASARSIAGSSRHHRERSTMLRGFQGWHLVILIVLLIVLFGWKRLPDAARSLGRSARIFKAEVDEMKNDGKSAASDDTVRSETIERRADDNPTQPQNPVTEKAPRTDNGPTNT